MHRRGSEQRGRSPVAAQHRKSLPAINYARLLLERRGSQPPPATCRPQGSGGRLSPRSFDSGYADAEQRQATSTAADGGRPLLEVVSPPGEPDTVPAPSLEPPPGTHTDDNRNELSPGSAAGSGQLKVPSGAGSHLRLPETRRRFSVQDAARPMYREDIFYSGSVLKLKEYTSMVNSVPGVSKVPATF